MESSSTAAGGCKIEASAADEQGPDPGTKDGEQPASDGQGPDPGSKDA